MLRRMLQNRSGTAEIVGTVLFLVILFFFFSNVFLWHNQISQEMDRLIADKMNSAVRIEIITGQPVFDEQFYIKPEDYNTSVPDSYTLEFEPPPFYTAITQNSMRLIKNLQLCVHANYSDSDPRNEICYVEIYDRSLQGWVRTELTVKKNLAWSNTTLDSPSNYIDTGNDGMVRIRFVDQRRFGDDYRGTLAIDYMEVLPGPVALEVTNLGGVDVALSRLWMVSEAGHVYADFESISDSWVRGGSSRMIMLEGETGSGSQSIPATLDGENIVAQYSPPKGQTVTFRVLTKLGNTAACSCSFP